MGDQAEQFIHDFGEEVNQFSKIAFIRDQFKLLAGEEESEYHGYCIAAKNFLESQVNPNHSRLVSLPANLTAASIRSPEAVSRRSHNPKLR